MLRKVRHTQNLTLMPGILILGIGLFLSIPHAQGQIAIQITNLNVVAADTKATITWDTNIPTDARVDFGFDDTYGFYLFSNDYPRTDHALTITNLDGETTYHFKVTSKSGESAVASFDRTFKTLKHVDTNAPAISNVHVVYITGTSATMQWETDEDANSVVQFGTTSKYTGSASNGTRSKIHDLTLNNLRIATLYHFRVLSTDKDNNTATYHDQSFITLLNGEADKVALAITDVRPSTSNDPQLGTNSVTISWRTNKLATGYIGYGTTNRFGAAVNIPGFRDFFHSYTLNDLKPGTVYYFVVESRDAFGKTLRSEAFTFMTRTQAHDAPVPPSKREPIVLGFSTLEYTRPSALLKAVGSNDIFAIFNTRKYRVSGPTALRRYAGITIKVVQPSVLNAIPDIQLVKGNGEQTVYFLSRRPGGRVLKLALPTPSIFASYPRNRWSAIVTIDRIDITNFGNVALIKIAGSQTVYSIEGTMKRPFATAEAFEKRGYRYTDIVEVSSTHANYFMTGDALR